MYIKLAIQNMKKSIRNYVIYFVTITLTAAMMYSFLALGFSKEVLTMSENISMLTSGILGMSVLVALIASFVISYAIRFMLEERKKEFATYELLGMETSNIQKLFFIENGVIGMAAFFIGTFLGVGLSGVLVQIINHIFEMSHAYGQSCMAYCMWLVQNTELEKESGKRSVIQQIVWFLCGKA